MIGARVRWWPSSPSDLPQGLIVDPDAFLARGQAREVAGRKRLYRVEGRPALFVKVFTLPAGLPRLRYLLRPSKARHEAEAARRVAAQGFRVAAPLAVGEERRFGLLRRSFSVVAEIPAPDLRRALEQARSDTKERRALVEGFARFARRLHDAGIDQDDFAPNNFLVTEGPDFVVIDFERCAVGAPLGERRWKLLAKLRRHAARLPLTDQLRFLHSYLGPGCDRATRRDAWSRIARELHDVRRRDARHAARAAFQAGRHLAHEGETWTVRGRETLPLRTVALPTDEARALWVLAYQLERLGLPALRPVRLARDRVELADPGPPIAPADEARSQQRIRAARARFEAYGRFIAEPQWLVTRDGAVLLDLRAFQLQL